MSTTYSCLVCGTTHTLAQGCPQPQIRTSDGVHGSGGMSFCEYCKGYHSWIHSPNNMVCPFRPTALKTDSDVLAEILSELKRMHEELKLIRTRVR